LPYRFISASAVGAKTREGGREGGREGEKKDNYCLHKKEEWREGGREGGREG